MLPAFLVPYLIGIVTAPLAGMVVKPLVRGTVKTTIGVALQVKKLAAEAAEDVQDLAAEVSADFATDTGMNSEISGTAPRAGTRSGVSGTASKKA